MADFSLFPGFTESEWTDRQMRMGTGVEVGVEESTGEASEAGDTRSSAAQPL